MVARSILKLTGSSDKRMENDVYVHVGVLVDMHPQLAVWCVGDFKETTVLANPVLHCGECSAYAVQSRVVNKNIVVIIDRWPRLLCLWQVQRMSHDAPANRSSRTTLSSREGSDRIGWARRGNAGYGCAGSEEFSLSLSSIHAPPRVSCTCLN